MKINNEFTVHAPIERAWALLTDVEAIAPCMPGAQLTGIRPGPDGADAETYEGRVKVKMGPVVAEYKGTAVFVAKDDTAYRGVIDAKGKDTRGAGNASATITVHLRPAGDGTTVGIDTDLKISGKIAQFGAGMIQEVSEKLLGQFVACLEGKLAAPAEVASAEVAQAEVAPAEVAPAEVAPAESVARPDPEPTPVATASVPAPATPTPAVPTPVAPATASAPTTSTPTGPEPTTAGPAGTTTSSPPFPTSDLHLEDVTVPERTTAQRNGTHPATDPSTPTSPGPSTASADAAGPRREFQASPEPEALDLLDLAGGAAMKRLLPVAIAGAVAVAALVYVLVRR